MTGRICILHVSKRTSCWTRYWIRPSSTSCRLTYTLSVYRVNLKGWNDRDNFENYNHINCQGFWIFVILLTSSMKYYSQFRRPNSTLKSDFHNSFISNISLDSCVTSFISLLLLVNLHKSCCFTYFPHPLWPASKATSLPHLHSLQCTLILLQL